MYQCIVKKRPCDAHEKYFCKHLECIEMSFICYCMIRASQWEADGRATSSCTILYLAPWCQSLPAARMKNTTTYLKWEQREWQKHILFEKGFRCLFFCHIWEVLIKKHGCLKRGQDKGSQAITCFSSNRLAEEGLFWHTEKYLKGSKDHSKKWNDMVACMWWEGSGFV